MAETAFGTNNPLTVKAWAKELFVEGLKATKVRRFIGNTSSSCVQKRTELSKGPGDQVTVGLRVQLASAGVASDATLEGNEENLQLYNDAVKVDQLRNAVRTAGKMTEQRVPYDLRMENMEALRDWYADRMDASFFNQIGGATVNVTGANTTIVPYDIRYTGMNTPLAPTSTMLLIGGLGGPNSDTTEASLSATTTQSLTLQDIDRCVAKAKTLSPMVRPIKVNGEDKYVMFIHPAQTYQLRKGTSAGQYVDIQKAAMTGGQIEDNPLYTGALGEYNGTILHEDARVPIVQTTPNSGAAASFYRAIFCGAQAAAIAFGQDNRAGENMTWVEELFDYGNKSGVSAGMIYGLKKLVFNSRDFSTIVVSSYAPAP